jgi:hypothetical protein
MEQKTITVNGVEIIAHVDGSITRPYHSELKRTFGYDHSTGYKKIGLGEKMFSMHRIIAQALHPDFSEELHVDHQNGDKVDNRIENLRMVTSQQNHRAHRAKRKNCSSIYRGVNWDKATGKWRAKCKIDEGLKHLGYFDVERDAAIARDSYAFSQGFHIEGLNFPENYSELSNNQ